MNNKKIEWILRIAVAGEFIGHGVFALQVKQGWIPYFTALGISADSAMIMLPWIGIADIALAILILIRPIPIALLWMAFWGFWTALIRPLSGGSWWDFIERFANWGAPLALLYLVKGSLPKGWKNWWK